MSLKAFLAAVRGYREKVGGGDEAPVAGLSRSELDALMEEYPDTPPEAPATDVPAG